MSVVTHHTSLPDSSQKTDFYNLIDNSTCTGILDADIASTAAIAGSKLATITTAGKIDGSSITNLANIPGGAGLVPMANLNTGSTSGLIPLLNSNNAPPTYYPYIKLSNTQTSGTGGGDTTSGSFLTVILNTKDNDTASIGTLSTNVLTLPAGTYLVSGYVPFSGNSPALQIRLWNNTDSAVLINGSNNNGDSSTNVAATCFVRGLFTLAGSKNVLLQYRSSTSTTNGQGVPNSFGTEVYAVLEFTKVG